MATFPSKDIIVYQPTSADSLIKGLAKIIIRLANVGESNEDQTINVRYYDNILIYVIGPNIFFSTNQKTKLMNAINKHTNIMGGSYHTMVNTPKNHVSLLHHNRSQWGLSVIFGYHIRFTKAILVDVNHIIRPGITKLSSVENFKLSLQNIPNIQYHFCTNFQSHVHILDYNFRDILVYLDEINVGRPFIIGIEAPQPIKVKKQSKIFEFDSAAAVKCYGCKCSIFGYFYVSWNCNYYYCTVCRHKKRYSVAESYIAFSKAKIEDYQWRDEELKNCYELTKDVLDAKACNMYLKITTPTRKLAFVNSDEFIIKFNELREIFQKAAITDVIITGSI